MNKLSHGRVIGIDVSRDWLDLYYLPDGLRRRIPNLAEGHAAVADFARERDAMQRDFESIGTRILTRGTKAQPIKEAA